MSRKAEKRKQGRAEKNAIQASRPTPGGPIEVPTEQPSPKVNISFEYIKAGDTLCLSRCDSEDVKRVADCLRKMCSLTWLGLSSSDGLRYKEIPDTSLRFDRPDHVDKALPFTEVRFSQKGRVWGVRSGGSFHVVWFDPNHEVTGG